MKRQNFCDASGLSCYPHLISCLIIFLQLDLKHIHEVNFFPSDNDFTQALLVVLVTYMISANGQCPNKHCLNLKGASLIIHIHPADHDLSGSTMICVFLCWRLFNTFFCNSQKVRYEPVLIILIEAWSTHNWVKQTLDPSDYNHCFRSENLAFCKNMH